MKIFFYIIFLFLIKINLKSENIDIKDIFSDKKEFEIKKLTKDLNELLEKINNLIFLIENLKKDIKKQELYLNSLKTQLEKNKKESEAIHNSITIIINKIKEKLNIYTKNLEENYSEKVKKDLNKLKLKLDDKYLKTENETNIYF